MKNLLTTILLLLVAANMGYARQMDAPEHIISVDAVHDQIFWADPANTANMPANRADRVRYLASQLQRNAAAVSAELVFLNEEIKPEDLNGSDLLFIHVPSAPYTENEVQAITGFLKTGGSLFLAMDVDYWSTLGQVNVNELISPFGIQFGEDSPDTDVGAITKKGKVTRQAVKIPYHGSRIVTGGSPFAFAVGDGEVSFAMHKELEGGGKIIVMGEAMASLYMNSWEGVDDYQTEKFMQNVIQWLLE